MTMQATLPTGEPRILNRPLPGGRAHLLETRQWVPAGVAETFEFFADASNLGAITPPFLGFEIRTPLPIEMRAGALIEYRIRLMGVPMTWLTRIECWERGRSFVDVQLRGPYARWVHTHSFTPADGGTLVEDRVEYAVPFAPISDPVRGLFVGPTVERIFRHRHEAIARILGVKT
jgi:ligand-binding SRPBCC domain-containing protein